MKKRLACVCKATMNVPNERSIFIFGQETKRIS